MPVPEAFRISQKVSAVRILNASGTPFGHVLRILFLVLINTKSAPRDKMVEKENCTSNKQILLLLLLFLLLLLLLLLLLWRRRWLQVGRSLENQEG